MLKKIGIIVGLFCMMLVANSVTNTFWWRNAMHAINYKLGHYRDLGTSICGVGLVSMDEGGKVESFDVGCAGGMVSYSRYCLPYAKGDCMAMRVDFDKVKVRDVFSCQIRRWVPLIGASASRREPHHCSPITERIRKNSI